MLEEDRSEVKSVSTAVTIAENIVHDIETPFDINHFVYIGKFQCGYRNPQTEQGSCMYKFSPDSFDSDVCEIRQIQRTDMYKMKDLGMVSSAVGDNIRMLVTLELLPGISETIR